ncbi:MAG: hypothetical protein AAGI91_05680 [Bacteroidota bacterium]
MNFLSNPIVARLLWVFPTLLFVISVSLLWAGLGQREAATAGVPVEAEVLGIETRERAEITIGQVLLRYVPPGETEAIERAVELPLTLLKSIEARAYETVTIRALPGSDQIVLDPYKRAQWVLSFSFSAMALIGAIGLSVMVGSWNRFLSEHGDPSEAHLTQSTASR